MAEPAPTSAIPAANGESKSSIQLKRLQEANAKYKKLLQLAKERIQQQEEELQSVRDDNERLKGEANEGANEEVRITDEPTTGTEEVTSIVQVCQRVKQAGPQTGMEEIWALLEFEAVPMNDIGELANTRQYREWKRFDTETQLQDFIRRDTGEPLALPPYSMSPEQSIKIQREAATQVSQVTEEFRRFRVRSELARKQVESQIRELQNLKVASAAHRIEGHDLQHDSEQARTLNAELDRVKSELASQDAHWKEAYNILLQENQALKSSGSEALLASQWRHRYEACLKDKAELESRLQGVYGKNDNEDDKWEAKYRDLKESFRIYRKKAKEIFETQSQGGVISAPGMASFALNDQSSAEAKLSYLKNLMVNFLAASDDVKEHMETAIATVLKFTPDDLEKIQKQKAGSDAWFSIY
ncbi:hypothetical protein MPSEU_000864000 [Mayamaea pseudoterrestris]|nr:hypothetical protein MPSEU_000864000 [Mayamaea pseudoterrestris]